jgi:hypothetical protein
MSEPMNAREFRRQLDEVLRQRDPAALRQFLIAAGQWDADNTPADLDRAMWMMIAASAALVDLHAGGAGALGARQRRRTYPALTRSRGYEGWPRRTREDPRIAASTQQSARPLRAQRKFVQGQGRSAHHGEQTVAARRPEAAG